MVVPFRIVMLEKRSPNLAGDKGETYLLFVFTNCPSYLR